LACTTIRAGLRRYTQKVSPSSPSAPSCCRRISATRTCCRVGYLDWLVDRSEFKTKVDETAAKLAGLAPLSMANMKRDDRAVRPAEPDIPKIAKASASARPRRLRED